VANYLAKKFPQATEIDVQEFQCTIYIDDGKGGREAIRCTTPRAVKTFIAHFDDDKYPELKEEMKHV
jgi:hypothetical protein